MSKKLRQKACFIIGGCLFFILISIAKGQGIGQLSSNPIAYLVNEHNNSIHQKDFPINIIRPFYHYKNQSLLNITYASYNYYNSGVIFCDKQTAKFLSDYMLYRMKNKIIAKGKNTDNMLLNEFILANKEIFNEIGNEWNYMPFSPNYKKIQNPNFFHFVGIVGKEIINKLQDKNINVEYFLKQLKNE